MTAVVICYSLRLSFNSVREIFDIFFYSQKHLLSIKMVETFNKFFFQFFLIYCLKFAKTKHLIKEIQKISMKKIQCRIAAQIEF